MVFRFPGVRGQYLSWDTPSTLSCVLHPRHGLVWMAKHTHCTSLDLIKGLVQQVKSDWVVKICKFRIKRNFRVKVAVAVEFRVRRPILNKRLHHRGQPVRRLHWESAFVSPPHHTIFGKCKGSIYQNTLYKKKVCFILADDRVVSTYVKYLYSWPIALMYTFESFTNFSISLCVASFSPVWR